MAARVVALDLDPQDRLLLTLAQVAFPLVPRPFAALGEQADLSEEEVIARLSEHKRERLLRRIGPVLEPAALGLTTELVAARVKSEELDAVGAAVAAWPAVTHCYARQHPVNLWFTTAAASPTWFEQAVAEMSTWAGVCGVWRLPTLRRFKIGVHFDLVGKSNAAEARGDRLRGSLVGQNFAFCPWQTTSGRETSSRPAVELLRVIETDLPLATAPFAQLASAQAGSPSADELLSVMADWLACGRMRRYGAQLDHRRVGFRANAMTVWSVPPDQVESVGRQMAAAPEVTHCYERPSFDGFPFNLYAMIHGRSRQQCLAVAERLTSVCQITAPLPLFSTTEFKKSSPRYSQLLAGPSQVV